VLKGNYDDVIANEEAKTNFLDDCTAKLSSNNTSDLACVDVRPGSIIVQIEGEENALDELVKQVTDSGTFEIPGIPKFEATAEKIVRTTTTGPAAATTTKHPLEPLFAMFPFKMTVEIFVAICVGIVLIIVLITIIIVVLIFCCCKRCTTVKEKDVSEKKEEEEEEEDPAIFITETLVESTPVPKTSSASKKSNASNSAAQEAGETEDKAGEAGDDAGGDGDA